MRTLRISHLLDRLRIHQRRHILVEVRARAEGVDQALVAGHMSHNTQLHLRIIRTQKAREARAGNESRTNFPAFRRAVRNVLQVRLYRAQASCCGNRLRIRGVNSVIRGVDGRLQVFHHRGQLRLLAETLESGQEGDRFLIIRIVDDELVDFRRVGGVAACRLLGTLQPQRGEQHCLQLLRRAEVHFPLRLKIISMRIQRILMVSHHVESNLLSLLSLGVEILVNFLQLRRIDTRSGFLHTRQHLRDRQFNIGQQAKLAVAVDELRQVALQSHQVGRACKGVSARTHELTSQPVELRLTLLNLFLHRLDAKEGVCRLFDGFARFIRRGEECGEFNVESRCGEFQADRLGEQQGFLVTPHADGPLLEGFVEHAANLLSRITLRGCAFISEEIKGRLRVVGDENLAVAESLAHRNRAGKEGNASFEGFFFAQALGFFLVTLLKLRVGLISGILTSDILTSGILMNGIITHVPRRAGRKIHAAQVNSQRMMVWRNEPQGVSPRPAWLRVAFQQHEKRVHRRLTRVLYGSQRIGDAALLPVRRVGVDRRVGKLRSLGSCHSLGFPGGVLRKPLF